MRYREDEPPEELADWLRAGIRRTEAIAWRRWSFTLDEAKAWLGKEISTGITAAQWRAAGVTPDTVDSWRTAGIVAAEAVHWHELGFTLDQAKEHKRKGRSPDSAFLLKHSTPINPSASHGVLRASRSNQDVQKLISAGVRGDLVHGYYRAQWLDDEAVAWAKAGIEAHDAKLWAALGITPAEAGEIPRADQDPVRVMREWWQAGIPFDEVGDWLGAGLSAKEAAAQRANGVTVEQAAALRALRRAPQ